MSESKHLEQRDSRDRLIDILGIAETSPLRDVVVSDELKVQFQRAARITISPGQLGVRYELRDHNGDGPPAHRDAPLERSEDGKPVPVVAVGDGGPLQLITPAIVEDSTFTIHAAKRHPLDDGTFSVREVFLRQSVHVKVGLDVELPARVRIAGDVEPLFPAMLGDPDPRITMYGSTVTVEIDGAQDGVDYDLISVAEDDTWTPRSGAAVRGLGEGVTIAVVSTPLREDLVLRVRATKKYTVAEARAVEVDLLTAPLAVKLRADPDLAVSSTTGPIFDHAGAPVIRVEATQTSAAYQLYARPIHDRELTAAMVMVRPPWTGVWADLDGFVPVGDVVPGTGGAIELPLGPCTEDTVVLVRASKLHLAANPATSAMQLKHEVTIYLRPDPDPGPALRVTLRGGLTTGVIELLGGQPGVLYFLRPQPDGPDLGLPAYVHKRDEDALPRFKGVGQMRLGADLVIADEGGGEAPPFTLTAPLPIGAQIYVLAVKAQSQLSAPLTRSARILPVPEIRPVQIGVDTGHTAKILVHPAAASERYQLTLAGAPQGDAGDGGDADLILTSAPVTQDVIFAVDVGPRNDPGIPVHRRIPVSVPLRPRAALTVNLLDGDPQAPDGVRLVDHAAGVRVAIDTSEPGIIYRLIGDDGHGERTLSASDLVGTGATITLQIDHAVEDVDVRVRAIRPFFPDTAEALQPQLLLDPVLPLKVRADPTLPVTTDPAPIVEPGQATALVVASSQTSARYELYVRPVADADRRFGGEEPAPVVETLVDDGPPARALRPPAPALWDPGAGFVRVGEPLAGTGGPLPLPLPNVDADLVAVIRVSKLHRAEPRLESALQLLAGALILVTPDLRPKLTVRAAISGAQTFESIEFLGGQPGVFYVLLDGDGQPLGEPGYVHSKDLAAPPTNRGIGQLRLGIDLVVPRDTGSTDDPPDPATADVLPPLVSTGPRPLGAAWTVRATWALTRVARRLPGLATISATPQILALPPQVAPGVATTIQVKTSAVGERYWLTLDGAQLGPIQLGDGNDLLFTTPALTRTTRLLVHCARDDAAATAVVRIVAVDVAVGA